MFLTALAIFGACLLIYFGGLIFVLSEINKVESAYTNAESTFSRRQRAETVKIIADVHKENIKTLHNFYIQKGDEVAFIENIEKLGQQTGLDFEIDSIDVLSKDSSSFKENISVKIKIEGSWSQILRFLESLEKTYFGVSIEEVNLNADGLGDWSGHIRLLVFREK